MHELWRRVEELEHKVSLIIATEHWSALAHLAIVRGQLGTLTSELEAEVAEANEALNKALRLAGMDHLCVIDKPAATPVT